MSRILQVLAAPGSGGAETFVCDLSCALSAQGNSMHMAFLSRAADLGRDAEFEVDFLARLDAHGVSYSFLGHDCRRKPWLGLARLRRLVHEQRIELIHSHLAFGNIFAAGVPRVPLVYTHHSEKVRFSRAFWTYFRYRAAHFIGISQTCTANLQTYAGQGARVSMIVNGINLTGIPSRPAISDRAVLRAISVGRIAAQKNYPLLARAVAELDPARRSRLVVDIYGEGDQTIVANCEDILRVSDVPPSTLRFRGVSSKIREILQDYDMFLMSSDWEGLPIALIEAAAAGLPTVVTDVGGCREITGTGLDSVTAGIVVPPGDALAFRDAIAKMLDDAALRVRWSRNAREVAQGFSITQSAEDHAGLYQEVLK